MHNRNEPPERLISRIMEFAIGLALSALLIKWAVCTLIGIWPAILVIALVGIAGVVVWRVRKHNRDHRL